jgi:hypothetical protein
MRIEFAVRCESDVPYCIVMRSGSWSHRLQPVRLTDLRTSKSHSLKPVLLCSIAFLADRAILVSS